MFSLYAELLILHGDDEQLSKLLMGASFRLRKIEEPVFISETRVVKKLFRPEIVRLLAQLKKTNNIPALEELIQLTPGGLFDMMRIKGLGGKKLHIIWKKAGIDSPEALSEACRKNKLSGIAGFGKKTQENIIAAIDQMNSSTSRFHFAFVADIADHLVTQLKKLSKIKTISLCGEIRRKSLTVPGIEIITTINAKKLKSIAPKKLLIISSSTNAISSGHTTDEIPVFIYHVDESKYYPELFSRTGSENHVEKVWARIENKTALISEQLIYKKAGLPYIEPGMREDVAEWDFEPNELITADDIKGVVHNHTNWSDGVDKLKDFALACKKRNYEYVVISDHSKNAHYAGGLKEEKVLKQMSEIDELNNQLKPFRIFKSIECDILVSGDLDYSDEFLKKFDLVIVSVHQLLKMDEQKATKRILKAIENPYTTILGHMTGRQLLIRPGYPLDFKKVIDACAANKVIIEINANPYRLDMDWTHIPYAMKKGVMLSINPDAHSIGEIDNIKWGVEAARKGGLTKKMTWNAMSLKQAEAWLKKYGKRN